MVTLFFDLVRCGSVLTAALAFGLPLFGFIPLVLRLRRYTRWRARTRAAAGLLLGVYFRVLEVILVSLYCRVRQILVGCVCFF